MGNRYKTGDYHIILFDIYGTPQLKIKEDITSYTMGLERAHEELNLHDDLKSYVILRVIKNNLDNSGLKSVQ